MHPTPKSRVLSGPALAAAGPEVRGAPTFAVPRTRGARCAAATPWRKVFAGRALGALAAVAALCVCNPTLKGNGVYAERPIDPGPFVGLRLEQGVDGVVTVAPGLAPAATVSGDENLVRDHLRTQLEVEGVGSAAVTVLHVWLDPADFQPVVPPRVVASQPAFSRVDARQGSAVELKRPAGSTAAGGPLAVVLDAASLDARQYPTAGAAVTLTGGASALLHSDGPVVGSVERGRLDNTAGTGPCAVTTTAAATVACN